MKNKKYESKELTFISLFSGCGGFDKGFEENGFVSLGAFDNDPIVIDTYRNNFKGPSYVHDLSEQTLPIDFKPGQVDVIISGSPCQGFSTAGLRKIDDPRNSLLLVGGNIAIKLMPKVFIAENVMGSLSGEHKKYWEELNNSLKNVGYKITFFKCEGTRVGLAQIRKRVFLIAWKGNTEIELSYNPCPKKNLGDVLQDLESVQGQNLYHIINKKETLELINSIKYGQKLCNVRSGDNAIHTWDIPKIFGEVNEEEKMVLNTIKSLRRKIRLRPKGDADPVLKEDIDKHLKIDSQHILTNLVNKKYLKLKDGRYDLVNTYNGLYKRLRLDQPSMTVDTRFGSPRFFLHPMENRGFTVREAARIQGFKDDFEFKGSIHQQFKMIGNAVPPPMANLISSLIKKNILLDE